MIDDISDARLAAMLRNHLNKNCVCKKTKGIRLCGSRVMHQTATQPKVFIVANNEYSSTYGNIFCRNTWACPRCSAIVMAKKGAQIAAAIEALDKWHKQHCFMMTLTLPHVETMSCEQTFTILRQSWRLFTRERKQKRKRNGGNSNKKYSYVKGNDAWGKFVENFKIKHTVRVYEFTWGENGWHPHIHALIWVPANLLKKAKDYEAELNERWWNCCKRTATKILQNDTFVKSLYADYKKSHPGLTFSKDEHGEIRKQNSSYYISGWGGDSEVTGNVERKATNEGHFTPYQILERAYKEPTKREFFLNLFTEYILATAGHRRTEFSKTGINDIANKWKQTQHWIETIKKKAMDKAKNPLQVVCWFTEPQWLQICCIEKHENPQIIPDILYLARLPSAFRLICSLLNNYDIHLREEQSQSDEETKIINSIFASITA